MINLIMAFLLATLSLISSNGETFKVTYDKGAVWSCTVFQQQKVGTPDANFPDGRYTPKHCWSITRDSTSYEDDWALITPEDTDWLVWAEVQYINGHDMVSTVVSNKVRVHR